MTQTPEHIWAWYFLPKKRDDLIHGGWCENPDRKEAEYIRKDVSDARIAELLEAIPRAYQAALDDAAAEVTNWHSCDGGCVGQLTIPDDLIQRLAKGGDA